MVSPIKASSLAIVFMLFVCSVFSQTLSELESKRAMLSNGWSLTPAGTNLPVGEFPMAGIKGAPAPSPVRAVFLNTDKKVGSGEN